MKNTIVMVSAVLLLAACANRPYAQVNAHNGGVAGSIGQTWRW